MNLFDEAEEKVFVCRRRGASDEMLNMQEPKTDWQTTFIAPLFRRKKKVFPFVGIINLFRFCKNKSNFQSRCRRRKETFNRRHKSVDLRLIPGNRPCRVFRSHNWARKNKRERTLTVMTKDRWKSSRRIKILRSSVPPSGVHTRH